VSAFQGGPAASSRAFAMVRTGRLCRSDASELTTAIPSTISILADCSSGPEPYSSAVIRLCSHAEPVRSRGQVEESSLHDGVLATLDGLTKNTSK
jgi:hypothetical protein